MMSPVMTLLDVLQLWTKERACCLQMITSRSSRRRKRKRRRRRRRSNKEQLLRAVLVEQLFTVCTVCPFLSVIVWWDVDVVYVLVMSAPKKRAIAWSDSEDSEAEEQSVDRVTSHTGSMAMDSDRWAQSILYKGVLTHNLLLRLR